MRAKLLVFQQLFRSTQTQTSHYKCINIKVKKTQKKTQLIFLYQTAIKIIKKTLV